MYKKERRETSVRSQGSADTALNNLKDSKLNILFFHNTLPEYRIGWFQNLSQISNVEFVFTNEGLNKKDYGFNIEYDRIKGLRCTFLVKGRIGIKQMKKILSDIEKFDFVELPPIDSLHEVIFSAYIVRTCRKHRVKIGYFWEKWESPRETQPLKRRIKNLILRIIPKAIYKYSDVFFAVGQKSKEYFISNGIDEKKIVIIPDVSETPPCDYIDIRKQHSIPADKKIIMYLGRMMPQKGVCYLIKAFCELDEITRKDSHLLIAGDGGDLENCKKIARKYDIDNISFAGAIEPRIRGNYFSQCDIFVYPVTYHGGWVDVWGLTLNEAVQHGKVVIATDAVGSAYELIVNDVNGYRVEPENTKALKEVLKESLSSSIIKSAVVKDAELMRIYSFRNMAEQYLKVAKDVCNYI